MSSHTHERHDELCVYWIPADTDVPMQFKSLNNEWKSIVNFLGGYMEVVRTMEMSRLSCGCAMVMVVDEEGLLKRLPINARASIYYPHGFGIAGDVFLVGEGYIDGEPDFISLPQSMSTWEGPGNPVPSTKQPWEV